MAYEHACFISYTHGQHSLMQSFVEQVGEALSSELEAYFGGEAVYIDRERLQPGYLYNEALAASLCRSVCMVVVYTPWYEHSTYCLREYTAMRRLEERRLGALAIGTDTARGLIIPVILRGRRETLPAPIRARSHYLDFSQFTTASRRILRNSRYLSRIVDVAEYIDEVRRSLETAGVVPGDDCAGFTLPAENELDGWSAAGQTAPPFPGRTP